tara:strand:+ start:62 stop:277 length:216 start_codon:yes stop_codon:yes gene_type:complete
VAYSISFGAFHPSARMEKLSKPRISLWLLESSADRAEIPVVARPSIALVNDLRENKDVDALSFIPLFPKFI